MRILPVLLILLCGCTVTIPFLAPKEVEPFSLDIINMPPPERLIWIRRDSCTIEAVAPRNVVGYVLDDVQHKQVVNDKIVAAQPCDCPWGAETVVLKYNTGIEIFHAIKKVPCQ